MADINIPVQVIVTAIDKATAPLKQVGKSFSDVGGGFEDFKKNALVASAGMVAVGATALAMGKQFVTAASFMEQAEVAFNTLTGSAEQGKKTLEELISFAAKTPFEIPQILEQSKRLLAMGTTAEDLIPTFKMLGDVAAGVGMEKLPQLILAFGQIQAKGRLMGTELRQLTEAGFNLADALGITNAELEEMVSAGEIGFDKVKEGFANVTSEGGRFFNLMSEQAKTTGGQISNFNDNVFKLKATIGEALLPSVNQLIQTLTPLIAQFAEWATNHQELIVTGLKIALVIGGIGLAVLGVTAIVIPFIATFKTLTFVISGSITVITALVGILGGPLTLAILAIIAIVAVLAAAWKNNWGGIREKTEAFVNWFKATAWPIIETVFNFISDAVDRWADKWIDRFVAAKNAVLFVVDAIKSLVAKANELTSKVAGGLKIPGFATGGIVPGPVGAPVSATVHGGEKILPVTSEDDGVGKGGAVITVNIGMYAGTETEKRNIALALMREIAEVARSRNKDITELFNISA